MILVTLLPQTFIRSIICARFTLIEPFIATEQKQN
ncbi:hypothetical protein VC_A0626 [Vibrio cholerae O1 biovar El Tor str. N16961]|uniref:Uncharacterized protein n=2 Tax=Vibrio cholerae TaxID=666 RepID=Q9KLW5_VIBCH|nr:hypothetical protein VC_A0626 [Vibrio cholerae O1 biovar El Tor str. N16961]ACP07546.1 conserved hypothetical protein [Vibrio cholerae M66-2]